MVMVLSMIFDKRAIGKPNLPTTTLGWTIGGSWKGFSISVLFQGSFDYSFAINGTGIESGKRVSSSHFTKSVGHRNVMKMEKVLSSHV